ncbi:MAG: TPM domain-containing protein [Planctomycetota bacterium]
MTTISKLDYKRPASRVFVLSMLVLLLFSSLVLGRQLPTEEPQQSPQQTRQSPPPIPLQQGRIEVTEIPSPRLRDAWVVDLSGTVSAEAIDYINRIGDEVNEAIGREMCVVVIKTTSGREHRQFATNLFNHWGVGKPGIPIAPSAWRDNGVMLFVAVDDRQAELVLGDGVDSDEKVRIAQQIIDDIVVPNFADGEGDSGLYQGFRAIATRIFAITNLNAPALLPSVSGDGEKARGPKRKQRGPVTWLPWIAGFGVIGGIGLLIGGRYYMRYRTRTCETCQLQMVLLEEDQDDQFLDPGEQLEEHLGSVDYDVWACLECEDVLRIRYGTFFTSYSHCPRCNYVTVHRVEQVLVAANYTHGGKVRVIEDCGHCSYVNRYVYRTPKLVKSSSSSSGGSFGGGGGGGGSGFSGGSSSGRGASGGW